MSHYIQSLPSFQGYEMDVLRLDKIHPHYGGNKLFKLKYNVEALRSQFPQMPLLTFGGAHSNHIYSTAAYCKEHGIRSIGVIRGEKDLLNESPTLQFAAENGMQLHFISRQEYKGKRDEELIETLRNKLGDFYLVPEGGNNSLGVKGCMEIVDYAPGNYGYIFCACGTGCTYSGILSSLIENQILIGISVLKGENALIDDVNAYSQEFKFNPIKDFAGDKINTSTLINGYHFGGYAKHTEELLQFKKATESLMDLNLDYIYTSKLVFAVFDLITNSKLLPDKRILIIHSGGQQGIAAYEKRYGINM